MYHLYISNINKCLTCQIVAVFSLLLLSKYLFFKIVKEHIHVYSGLFYVFSLNPFDLMKI